MTREKTPRRPLEEALEPTGKGQKAEQLPADMNKKSAQKVHRQSTGLAKTDARYWNQPGKLTKAPGSPNYSMQVQFKGKRMRFTCSTSNKQSAAVTAAGICKDLVTLGIDETVLKHRPQTEKGPKIATVGEWITAARTVSTANDSTFTGYARALRQIAGGLVALKKNRKRFGPKKGGSNQYRETVEAVSLSAFTLSAIQKWRLAYVKKAKNPLQEKAKQTSCNSLVRQAGSLFSGRITYYLKDELALPAPRPFEIPPELKGPKQKQHPLYFPRQNSRYHSTIDLQAILQAARVELESEKPALFLALLLSVGAGLRRSEMDSLRWEQVDTAKKLIRVDITEVADLKTADSRGEVEIDDKLAGILQGFKAKAGGKGYVIEAKQSRKSPKGSKGWGTKAWGQHYRAETVFAGLIEWLRQKGVTARKPIHELRKELGALITQQHGIYAASRALRHSTVSTTAAHYADKKARSTVDIGGMILTPPENVISIQEPATAPEQDTPKTATR